MDYTLKDNRVILTTSNTGIQILWFKDLKSFTISGTALYFEMNFGNWQVKESDLTGYNGWGVAPPIATIYADTMTAINIFENTTVISGTVTANTVPYKVLATRDPLPTDDVSKGYTIFTQWLNESTNPANLFQCSNNATGAAVWNWLQYVNL